METGQSRLFTAVGTVQFSPDPNNPGRILSSGTATFTASNGDKLQMAVNGALDLATGVDMGVFRFVGGTGRFDGVGGAGDFVVELNPATGAFKFTAVGRINY